MAVFRIEKSRNYTVMSNYHLRDKSISCKACGLLSKMLSLPDNWDYTTRGLAMICKDGVDSIGSALKELERAGYLVRNTIRDDHGRIRDVEYVIYESPHPHDHVTGSPDTENPDTVDPPLASPHPDNPTQLNTKEYITYETNTKTSITDSFIPQQKMKDWKKEREKICQQIEYDYIVSPANREQLDELVEIIVEIELNRKPITRIGKDAEYPSDYVRQRMRKLTSEHIRKVLDGISENQTQVHNTKAYLLASLFNVTATMDNYYTMQVNHDKNRLS